MTLNLHGLPPDHTATALDRLTPPSAARTPQDDDDRLARLIWTTISLPGDITATRLVHTLGAATALEAIWPTNPDPRTIPQRLHDAYLEHGLYWQPGPNLTTPLARWHTNANPANITTALAATAELTDTVFLTPTDLEWPDQLNDLGDHTPIGLTARGRIDVLPGIQLIAVTGDSGDPYGHTTGYRLAAELTTRGRGIVNANRPGIDQAALTAANDSDGTPVIVTAGGIDTTPLPTNLNPTTTIVLSEAPATTAATAWHQLTANRLVAALAAKVVVVQASSLGEPMSLAANAANLSRPIVAVPGPQGPHLSGVITLLNDFNATAAVDASGVLSAERLAYPTNASLLDKVRGQLRTAERTQATHLAIALDLGISTISHALGQLAAAGQAQQDERGWFAIG